jgi:hypothetical protein
MMAYVIVALALVVLIGAAKRREQGAGVSGELELDR